jgi:hypothetical protein
MVVMFHNFVETFTPSKWDKGEYTTTFSRFESFWKNFMKRDIDLSVWKTT